MLRLVVSIIWFLSVLWLFEMDGKDALCLLICFHRFINCREESRSNNE